MEKNPENLGVSCKSSKTDLTQKVVEEHTDFLNLMSMYKYYLYEKVCTNMSAVVWELELVGSWEGYQKDIIYVHHISIPSSSSCSLLLG